MGVYNPAFLRQVEQKRAARAEADAARIRAEALRKHGIPSREFEDNRTRRDGRQRMRERDEGGARHRRAEALAVPEAASILREYAEACAARKKREAGLPDFLRFPEPE